MKDCCEGCGCGLGADAQNAMICSFECTFCESCATEKLQNVCPNCGGEFVRRPVRPKAALAFSPQQAGKQSPVSEKHAALVSRYGSVPGWQR
jgi:hypothetical protein